MEDFILNSLSPQIKTWLDEDDLTRNFYYQKSLSSQKVKLYIKIKSPLILAGSDYFVAVFSTLGCDPKVFDFIRGWDGKSFGAQEVIEVPEAISFGIAVTAERLALNLLQHASSIATWTHQHVQLAKSRNIKLLDTRKTTPGLRSLEKYAVRVGGGFNHRLGQTDAWMIKDNHKTCLGGVAGVYEFFQKQGALYNNTVVEIHDLEELKHAQDLGLKFFMLDNFNPDQIREAIKFKKDKDHFEVSGGVKLSNLTDYLIDGVDAISMGSLIYSAPQVDISLKFRPV